MTAAYETSIAHDSATGGIAPARDVPSVPDQHTKPLWAAVSILGLAVAALFSNVVYQNAREAAAANAERSLLASPATLTSPAGFQPPAAPGKAPAGTPLAPTDMLDEKAPSVQAHVRPAARYTAAQVPFASQVQVHAPGDSVVTAPANGRAAVSHGGNAYSPIASGPSGSVHTATPRCTSCGHVESVAPVQRAVPTSGVGAVAGGVLGAVIGNQIGHGTGRAVATIAGAAGGGYLGNTVERRTRSDTAYNIHVRMDDGSLRTFERSAPITVGQPVTVEGNGFRLGRAAAYSTQSRTGYRQVAQPQGSYTTGQY